MRDFSSGSSGSAVYSLNYCMDDDDDDDNCSYYSFDDDALDNLTGTSS